MDKQWEILVLLIMVMFFMFFAIYNTIKLRGCEGTFYNMSLIINQTENKLNKTEQFYYDCKEKEIEWGSQLIKLGNFTPMIEECSQFCDSYDLNYLISDNIAEDKIHDLETDIEGYKIKRRSFYTDDYFCLCVSE